MENKQVVIYDYSGANFSAFDSIPKNQDGYYSISSAEIESNAFLNLDMFVI